MSFRLSKVLALAGIVSILAAAGCNFAASEDATSAGGEAEVECYADVDCELAASSCCGCATFAQPTTRGFADSCEDVVCPLPEACAPTVARCDSLGTCVLACAEVTCDLSCSGGFAVDEAGCQVCECGSAPSAPACASDEDCARVPADCCGCELGGLSIAVPVAEVDDFASALSCGEEPAICPGVNTCEPGAQPRCSAGVCTLGEAPGASPTDGGLDPAALALCGTPELGACPGGTVCVLNDPAAAESGNPGLGVCRTP